MTKRVLAALLALIMLFSALPMSVFAEQATMGWQWTVTVIGGNYYKSDGTASSTNKYTVYKSLDNSKDNDIGYKFVWNTDAGGGSYDGGWQLCITVNGAITDRTTAYIYDRNMENAAESWTAPGSSHTGTSAHPFTLYKSQYPTQDNRYGKRYTLIYDEGTDDTVTEMPNPKSETKISEESYADFIITGATPKRDGYNFLGWADSKNAKSVQYTAGSKIIVSSSKTIYAVWEEEKHEHKDSDGDGFCDKDKECVHEKQDGYCTVDGCKHGDTCCPKKSTEPEKPDAALIKELWVEFEVACVTPNSGHKDEAYQLEPALHGKYSVTDPVKVSDTTYTSTVTLPRADAVATYNADPEVNKEHTDTAPDKNNGVVTWTLTYNTTTKKWLATAPEAVDVECLTDVTFNITYNFRDKDTREKADHQPENPDYYTLGKALTLNSITAKGTFGKEFLEWRCDLDGDGVLETLENNTIPAGTSGNLTVYAYWKIPVNYTVYDENDQKISDLCGTDYVAEGTFANYDLRSGEKYGYNFDGWYQSKADLGNTGKRVSKLGEGKEKWEIVGKLTRKSYIIASDVRINNTDKEGTYKEEGKSYSWTHRYGGKFEETIDYQPMIKALKDKVMEVDAANGPVDAKIKLCFPGSTDKLFNEESVKTYGDPAANWNPGNNTAYIWGYATTVYRVTFDANGGSDVAAKDVDYGKSLGETYPIGNDFTTTKKEAKFLGWYTEEEYAKLEKGEDANAFDLGTEITKSMTLIAGWDDDTPMAPAYIVLYRNGDTATPYKTVSLGDKAIGSEIDLTELDVNDYYDGTNSGGKIDFYGWYNDGTWNVYKADPANAPAGLEKITVNGWTNIIGMVYDYEKVVVKALYDGSTDVTNAEVLYTGVARKGTNTKEFLDGLDLKLDKTGYTHEEWYKDGLEYTFTTEPINGWTNAYVKYARKSYNVVGKLFFNGKAVMKADGTSQYLSDALTGRYGDTINYSAIETWAKGLVVNEIDKANAPDAAATTVKIYKDGGKYEPNNTFGNPDVSPNYVWADVTTYYKVAFNSDGGSAVDAQTVKYGEKLAAFDEPTKDGYKFLGWFKDGEDTAFAFATPITQKTELTARWEKLYKIIYHGNGGLLVKDGKTFDQVTSAWLEPGQPTNLKDGVFTREHYTFTGWATSADGEKAYDAKQHDVIFPDTVFDADGNVHLYAAWTAVEYLISVDYRLKDDPAGGNVWVATIKGTVEDDLIVKLKNEITAAMIENQLAKKDLTETFAGYTPNFDHWFYASDKSEIPAGTMAIPTGRLPEPNLIMVYLKGTPNEYTVTFDPNSGEVEPTSKTVTFDDTYGELPTPTRTNYNFKGWYLNSTKITADTVVKTAENHTLKAAWSRNYYALTINYVDKKGKPVADSYEASVALGADFSVTSPSVKGYKLKDKGDAVIEGTMPGRNLTIEVVYIKKSTGGGSGTIDSPNKPTKKAPALTLNTDDHFAFINGYPDGSVQPEGNVTRAETAAILYRIMGDECQSYYKTSSSSYSDVARSAWYSTYVATLENAGVIVDTRTNGKFRPNDAITRAELASMIAQFADIDSASAAKFNDVGTIYWAAKEIAIAAKMGWINGYPDGSFRPDQNVTRAELMAMVNRALGRTPKSEDDLLSGMKTWRDNANVNAWYYLDVQEATNDHTYTKSGTHETWKKLL